MAPDPHFSSAGQDGIGVVRVQSVTLVGGDVYVQDARQAYQEVEGHKTDSPYTS